MSGFISGIASTFGSVEQTAGSLMSDASSAIGSFTGGGGLLSDLASAAQALAGGGVVTLGPFTFQDTEVPEQMPYGGQQRLAVQKMIGGDRQINTLGLDKDDIKWSGIMRSSDRESRAKQLQSMMASGKTFSLAWGHEHEQVVISSFQPVVEAFWISYTITCCVAPEGATSGQPDFLTSMADDAMSAVGLTPSDLTAATAALGQVQDAVSAVSSLVPGSSVFGKILNATGAAQSLLTGAQSAADGSLAGVISAAATGAGLLGATGATALINQMGGIVQAAGDLGAATQSLGYVNRMAHNLEAQF